MTGAGTWLRRIFDRRNTAAGEPEGRVDEHVRNGSSIAVGDALARELHEGAGEAPATITLTMREQIEQTPEMHLTVSVLDGSFDDALPDRRKATETYRRSPDVLDEGPVCERQCGLYSRGHGPSSFDRWLPGSPLSLEEDARGM